MKRILYILEAVEGGAWRHLKELISEIHGKTAECYVALSFERQLGNSDEVRSYLASRSVALYEIPMKRGATPGDMSSVIKLTKLIRRLKPDLVHAHSAKAGMLGRMAAKLSGVPSIYTPHCFPFLMRSDKLAHAYALAEKGVVKTTAAIIVISREEQEAARNLGYPENRIHFIPNGIASCNLELPETNNSGPLKLGFFGRGGPQKGNDEFMRLVEALNRRGVKTEGVMYGGETEFERRTSNVEFRTLNSSVNDKSGLGNYMRMCGHCSQAKVVEAMRGLDVVVLPSRWEGLPYVLLEALDAGVPISAYRVGGIGDVVEHGVSGLLADAEDFDGLVESTARLADSELRRRIAEGGRAAVKPYTLERMVESTVGVYERVLEKS